MCCKEQHFKSIICEVPPFCFVLIYRLCQINRRQKRMTVLYRKQWSICLDGNLSLTGSWWKSSETINSLWCVDIALKNWHWVFLSTIIEWIQKHFISTFADCLTLRALLLKMDSWVFHLDCFQLLGLELVPQVCPLKCVH